MNEVIPLCLNMHVFLIYFIIGLCAFVGALMAAQDTGVESPYIVALLASAVWPFALVVRIFYNVFKVV